MVINGNRSWFRPRLSLKITTPYLLLSLTLGLAAIYLVARMESERVNSAFSRQLSDSGQRVTDSIVRQEQEQLTGVRTIARLTGLPEALLAADQKALLQLVLPYAVTQQFARVVVLDRQGTTKLALQHIGPGPTDYRFDELGTYASWPFVQAVLQGRADDQGDKFIGFGHETTGWVLYTSGPIFQGKLQVGAVLVGTPLSRLVQRWREITLADVTIYDQRGEPMVTSLGDRLPLPLEPTLYQRAITQEQGAAERELAIDSRSYAEIVGPLRVRASETIGAIGVALSTTGANAQESQQATALLLLFAGASLAAILVGLWLARRIVAPIGRLVRASQAVATGDLSQQLEERSKDELGDLTRSFNQMVSGLRERERVRDVLGRFVSPTVADLVLQRPLDLSGELRMLTILFTDIRDFTTMSEVHHPADVVRTLNDYFAIVVGAAEKHGGLVNKFGGDSTLVLFGLTEGDGNSAAAARAAISAAIDIRRGLEQLNTRRKIMDQEPIMAGLGINTGRVIAGLIGAEQRMEYTVIGDAVNLSARIQGLTRTLGGDILMSGETLESFGEPEQLVVQDLGAHHVKGKQQEVHIYSILGWRGAHE